jgi:hypothetical protein
MEELYQSKQNLEFVRLGMLPQYLTFQILQQTPRLQLLGMDYIQPVSSRLGLVMRRLRSMLLPEHQLRMLL